MFWTPVASATLIVTLATCLRITWGTRRIGMLRRQQPKGIERWPPVSVVVAARDEQRHIQVAVESLLQLDYEDYEVLVVDDRSTDRTRIILDELAARHANLSVMHIDQLPPGWLGKNHALYRGAEQAGGHYLLFTDADVVMDRESLQRAMAHVIRNQVDHLAVSPDPVMPNWMLQSFVTLFVNLFGLYTRPWKVADPRSSAFVGIGAFNLVRREAYRQAGTHRRIAMRPDDDVKLGKIIKLEGYRQQFLWGTDMIQVPWYGSVGELVRGLEKNAFSGVDYRISLVLAASFVLLAVVIWPFLAVWLLEGPPRYLYAATLLLLLDRTWTTARELRQSSLSALLLPAAAALLIYVQWRAMLLTWIRGGIRWRGTHYPLSELKANKV